MAGGMYPGCGGHRVNAMGRARVNMCCCCTLLGVQKSLGQSVWKSSEFLFTLLDAVVCCMMSMHGLFSVENPYNASV